MSKIALDAFGGDYAPEEIVEGALLAAELEGISVILTGDEHRLRSLVGGKAGSNRIEIVHAPEVVQMDEEPVAAVRSKRDSSLVRGAQLVRQGEAQALVSAGSTGATLAAALFNIGRIKGVERPAISTILPTAAGFTLVLDVGANVDCRPSQLVQFAQMGSIYAAEVLKVPNPRVGLLNVGHEPGKGNQLAKEVYSLLQQTSLNFIGNVEGREVPGGHVDVVVCDGFLGNVVLKFAEGLSSTLLNMIKEEAKRSLVATAGALLMKPGFRRLKKRMDPNEYGGAPLLGINGVVIIAHGGSNAKAIYNALRVAREGVQNRYVEIIAERMAT
ncbi:MAG: phosphate acyltransferase PlsX [Limnochordia bacterium]|jgi:glycerol-3-phosphate acyltransferase PlsX|nr:phosphate acyltransferase PlsX [Bacillota bacterium]NLL08153.1 phosphate acyltransferase PlsX [Bacillota bacterium]